MAMGDVVLSNRNSNCLPATGRGATQASLGDDGGQGLAEYGLILGLIAILCIVAVLFLSGNIQGLLSNVGNSI
jgi:pilus assembly protein Flp/PilA